MCFYTGGFMADQTIEGEWRHVLPPQSNVGQVGFVNPKTGEVYRFNLTTKDMQQLMGALMRYVKPTVEDQQEFQALIDQCRKGG
jgi:hypothetical protein